MHMMLSQFIYNDDEIPIQIHSNIKFLAVADNHNILVYKLLNEGYKL